MQSAAKRSMTTVATFGFHDFRVSVIIIVLTDCVFYYRMCSHRRTYLFVREKY